MARLTIIGPEGRSEGELKPHTTIGRHPNNTIQVLDRIVSKEHCHVDLIDGQWRLKDLGSLNGTFINGERVSERFLRHGDEISMGSTRLVFSGDGVFEGANMAPPPAGSAAPVPPVAIPAANVTQAFGQPARNTAVPVPTPAIPLTPPLASSRVTMTPGMVESHIRSKISPLIEQSFVPERLIQDQATLRRDYEKLRVSYEVIRTIGVELDVDKLLFKILDCAFQLLPADRGVVLLYVTEADGTKVLKPRAVRSKKGEGDEVVLSTTIINEVIRDKAGVLSSDASVDSRFQGAHSIIMQGIRSSMAVPLIHTMELLGIIVVDSQIATNAFTEKDLQLFQNVANQAAIAIQNSLYARKLEQEAVTRERFQRLLSPAIAEQVISGKVEVAKGGELRDTTVLFTDIRGFTSMSESRNAQDIVDMLNEYFELMVEIVFQHEGTLDKFVGDELMALFGAPVAHTDDPYRAVKTALEMMRVLDEFNRTRMAEGEQPIHIGIGINSGDVVAGYLGSSKALEYTVIGDDVNIGARLCSLAKAGEIIISAATYNRVKDHFEVVKLAPTAVKGKANALEIYRVVGEKIRPSYATLPR